VFFLVCQSVRLAPVGRATPVANLAAGAAYSAITGAAGPAIGLLLTPRTPPIRRLVARNRSPCYRLFLPVTVENAMG
jgi:hypothetical protein